MITQKLLPISKRRSGLKNLGIKFIVCHDTGNDGSTAIQNVDYYIKSANEMEASAHTFIDDQNIINCVPLDEKAWHVRRNVTTDNELFNADANDYSIGVELCYSSKNKFDNFKAYKNYVKYIADLCKKYNLDPKKHLVGHYKLDPTRRTDPLNAFKHINKTWLQFIVDVDNYLPPSETCDISRFSMSEIINELKKRLGL